MSWSQKVEETLADYCTLLSLAIALIEIGYGDSLPRLHSEFSRLNSQQPEIQWDGETERSGAMDMASQLSEEMDPQYTEVVRKCLDRNFGVTRLLDHRQSRYAQRILRHPEKTRGAKEVLLATENSALSKRLKKMSHVNGDRMEKPHLEMGKTFMGEIMPHTNESKAMKFAEEWTDREDTAWTDGSRLEDGRVGCSIAWQEEEGWVGQTIHLGTNKEVYDAELCHMAGIEKAYTKEATEPAIYDLQQFPSSTTAMHG
ncbi:hypothetical protein FPQ18DRAFT_309156 [Pyronema domesticum]|nr:hypothetical protein FPQ18DRAFT_309156 [Pyronema domesticum]